MLGSLHVQLFPTALVAKKGFVLNKFQLFEIKLPFSWDNTLKVTNIELCLNIAICIAFNRYTTKTTGNVRLVKEQLHYLLQKLMMVGKLCCYENWKFNKIL